MFVVLEDSDSTTSHNCKHKSIPIASSTECKDSASSCAFFSKQSKSLALTKSFQHMLSLLPIVSLLKSCMMTTLQYLNSKKFILAALSNIVLFINTNSYS